MTDQIASPPAATVPDAVIDVPNRLRICDCPECEAVFAVPLAVYLRRSANHDSIFCAVCGAPIKLLNTDVRAAELALLTVQMVAEVRQQKFEIETLRTRLARIPRPAAGPIAAAELERRVKYIVNRATPALIEGDRTNFGKRICSICEAVMTPRSLRNHIHREHAADVAAIPAEFFDRP